MPATAKRPHASQGIYRTREECRALKQAVLDLWANGLQAKEIGARLDVEFEYVSVIVKRARAVGDPRAITRRHLNPDHARVVAEFGSQQARLERLIVAITGTTKASVWAARFRARHPDKSTR